MHMGEKFYMVPLILGVKGKCGLGLAIGNALPIQTTDLNEYDHNSNATHEDCKTTKWKG
ncbi:hypothetical protein SLEP1_g30537 [Rubroshorea leprosula]|uniref:Uncharacterized protein n=1 Tax=Rubroshorea leprosula TaxID=152421 RepID=A0AAV5K607_9ROSI|nr:hypothetical protein SLEP1_g30537 [Rubroshorea leprosula]